MSGIVSILIVPGGISGGLGDRLFWWSLAVSRLIAGAVAYPVNSWLIARGRGHAVRPGHTATRTSRARSSSSAR